MPELWIQDIARGFAKADLATVLCLGRAESNLIDALPAGSAKQIVRLEPDPKQAERLQKRYGGTVTILPAAFSDRDGSAMLHRFTIEAFDALRPASGLHTLFPGLREIGTVSVEAQAAVSLLDQIQLNSDAKNILILGAPGEEMSAIEQLTNLGVLNHFTHVLCRHPSEPLYEGAADGTALQARLVACGFSVQSWDISDPDRSLALWQKDAALLALIQERDDLREEVAGLCKSIGDARAQKAQSEEQHLAALKAENDRSGALAQERDSLIALSEAAAASKAELEASNTENDILKAQLQEAQNALDHGTTAYRARLRSEVWRLEAQISILQSILPLDSAL